MTIEVTQADRAMATRWSGHENSYLAKKLFAEHRLATRTDATPIAWTYVNEHWPLGSLGQPKYTPDDQVQDGWTEVPLYTHPPATDVAEQDDTALLERLADEACKRLGIDPNEIVDPVGPVRKKDDIIYAMYAFARDKFWDTEPNDVAALVLIAERLLDRGYVSKHIGEEHDDHMALVAALAPFTKGQNDG